MQRERQFFLGVDGGATKTEAVVIDQNDRVIGRGVAGASNYQTVGQPMAVRNLLRTVHDAAGKAKKRGVRAIAAAGFGIAAIDTERARKTMVRSLRPGMKNLVHTRFSVFNDIIAGFHTGTTRPYGAAVIAGTGSNAYARSIAGREYFAGGLGAVFSDEGSAYMIGKAVLRTAAMSADGRIPRSSLESAVQRRFRKRTIREISYLVNQPTFTKDKIAALAPLADRAAARGDRAAKEILQDALDGLVRMVRATTRRAGLSRRVFELVLIGGVFTNPSTQKKFTATVLRIAPRARCVRPEVPFAVGAARVARARFAR